MNTVEEAYQSERARNPMDTMTQLIAIVVILFGSVAAAQNEVIVPKYKVLEDETMLHYKRSVVIRVPARYTEPQLRAIAKEIKNMDPKKYDRTFIEYYLPEMEVGEGAWATSHYNPDLKIAVLGLSVKDYGILTSIPRNPDPSVRTIGRWVTSYALAEIVLVDGNYFLRKTFADGSHGQDKLNKTETAGEVRYYKIDSQYGDYFVIDSKGELISFDDEGLIGRGGETYTPPKPKVNKKPN